MVNLIRFADFLEYVDGWCCEVEGSLTPVSLLHNETFYSPVTSRGNPWFVSAGHIVYDRLCEVLGATFAGSIQDVLELAFKSYNVNDKNWRDEASLYEHQIATFADDGAKSIRCSGCDWGCQSRVDCFWAPWNRSWRDYLVYIQLLSPEYVENPNNFRENKTIINPIRSKFKSDPLEVKQWTASTLMKLWANIRNGEFSADELERLYNSLMKSHECLLGCCEFDDWESAQVPHWQTLKEETEQLRIARVPTSVTFGSFCTLMSVVDDDGEGFLDN